MANLGFMYVNGLGVEADNETALRLFKRAADKVFQNKKLLIRINLNFSLYIF